MLQSITVSSSAPALPPASVIPEMEIESDDVSAFMGRSQILDCVLDPDAVDADVRTRRLVLRCVSEICATLGAYALEERVVNVAVDAARNDPERAQSDADVAMLVDEIEGVMSSSVYSPLDRSEIWRVFALVEGQPVGQLDAWGHRYIAGME